MEKIVVRSAHNTNSIVALQSLMEEYGCMSVQELTEKAGKNRILHLVYRDEESYEKLMTDYGEFLSGNNNSNFEWGYLVSSEFVLCIGTHISFCHLDKELNIFPWRYMDRGVYLADTWWFNDEEILHDATSMPLTDFLRNTGKYL